MSAFDGLPIVACVAGIISAYRDGGELLKPLKEKRPSRQALPPSRSLEQSLDAALRDIEASNKQGFARFGEIFGRGDRGFLALEYSVHKHAY